MSDDRDELDEDEPDDREEREDELDEPLPEGGVEGSPRSGASFFAGFALGALLGVGAALLLAPERGAVTRKRLRRRLEALKDDAAERIESARGAAERELRRQRRRLRRHLPHR
jgi:hypothetical protein